MNELTKKFIDTVERAQRLSKDSEDAGEVAGVQYEVSVTEPVTIAYRFKPYTLEFDSKTGILCADSSLSYILFPSDSEEEIDNWLDQINKHLDDHEVDAPQPSEEPGKNVADLQEDHIETLNIYRIYDTNTLLMRYKQNGKIMYRDFNYYTEDPMHDAYKLEILYINPTNKQ